MLVPDVIKRYVFKTPNYVANFGIWHGLRLLIQIETSRRHNGRKKHHFTVPGYPTITLRDSVSDRATFWQCIVTRQYSLDGMGQASDLNRRYDDILSGGKRPLIIDAGANIGLSTLFFHRTYPRARIVCVEPEAENLGLLAENTSSLGKAVQVTPGAVWDTDEPLAIRNPDAGSSEMQVVGAAEASGPTVPVHTIDALLRHEPDTEPFILKLDIEGAQEQLFRSNTAWVSRFPLIILELDDWQFPWRGTARRFFATLSAYDFDYIIRGESIFCFRHDATARQLQAPRPPTTA